MANFSICINEWEKDCNISFDHSELTAQQRRGLKLLFDLDVPSWQKDNAGNKDLRGSLTFGAVKLNCTIHRAYVCTPSETETEPAQEWLQQEAATLTAMTDAEAVEYVRNLAAQKLKRRPVYECKPVETVELEEKQQPTKTEGV